MKLFPAIDLRDGRVVRLMRGNYDQSTVYDVDPIETAKSFAALGAQYVHVVDLDGARSGSRQNTDVIISIAELTHLRVECGGGIRTARDAQALLDAGVWRVVFGTTAAREPDVVCSVAHRYPGRVAVGIDARGERVATHGWEQDSNTTVDAILRTYEDAEVAFVVTEISRDGTLSGPDTTSLLRVLGNTNAEVVASGGVGSLDDLEALGRLRSPNGRQLEGAIVGRALYEGAVDLGQALTICQRMENEAS